MKPPRCGKSAHLNIIGVIDNPENRIIFFPGEDFHRQGDASFGTAGGPSPAQIDVIPPYHIVAQVDEYDVARVAAEQLARFTLDGQSCVVIPAATPQIPAEHGRQLCIYVDSNGKYARRRDLRTVRRNSRYLEITDGLVARSTHHHLTPQSGTRNRAHSNGT